MDREKKIIKVSFQGIAMNLFLVLFKAIVGFIANSIAIILDAVNNLTDAVSAIITIIGAKLSGKAPDKEHPFGHGRIEYFAAVIISAIVLGAGITSLKESFLKILSPADVHYEWYTLLVIIVAIFVKFFFGGYVKNVGKQIDSQSLIATGTDAFMDAVLSFSTLVGAIIFLVFGLNIEGYLGVVISIIIIKSAISILKETIDTMIGQRADAELTKNIKQKINDYKEVHGTYDLMLHNYGPSKLMGSAHIELDDDTTAKEIHALTRKISEEIFKEFGIILTLGIYASNDSGKAKVIKEKLEEIIKDYTDVLQLHGFYLDDEKKQVSFDIIIDFKCENSDNVKNEIIDKIKNLYPEYEYEVVLDTDISD